MATLAQTLDRAIGLHRAGELRQAEQLYGQILREDPHNVDALHLLGLMAGQFGRHDLAITLIDQALRVKPDFADAHNSLGNALRGQNKLADALASYRQALRFNPNHWEAHHNLGAALDADGKLEEALFHFRHVIRLKSDFAPAHFALGNVLHKQRKLDEAAASLRRALRLKPDYADAHRNLGNVLHHQGKLAEAAASYGAALRINPDMADAHSNLANVLLEQGKLDEAAASCERAVRLQPNLAEAHSNLGLILRRQGKISAAIASCQHASRLKPDLAEAHTNLADALQDEGKFDEAIASYRRALEWKPGLAEAHNNLGNAYRKQGQLAEAIASYREALRCRPGYAEAHSNLGNALRVQGKLDQAEASCREALRWKPDLADGHNNLGYVLQSQGRLAEAAASFRAALRHRPGLADACCNLSSVLLAQGHIDQALAGLHDALRLAPDHPMAWHQLGRLAREGKYRFEADELDHVRRLLAEPARSFKKKTLLHFTLAYLAERDGDFDVAFEHYRQGNACKRQSPELWTGFDIHELRRGIDAAIATFSPSFFASRASIGHPSEVPVFIVGMPRSGTTLVEQILSSHKSFAGAGELPDMGALADEVNDPGLMAGLSRETATGLAERYLRRLRRDAGGALHVSDKMPLNYLHLGLIAVMFPHARVIHCRRDPRDTCVSCFCENFETVPFSTSLEDLGKYYLEYARLMAHWRQVLPLAMFEVQYEDLVASPEAISRQLVAFCGLEWDERCMQFHQTRRPVQSASNLQVRQPIHARSVGRWQRFQNHLGGLLDILMPCLGDPRGAISPLPLCVP